MTFSAPPVKFIDGGVFRKGSWAWNEVDSIWVQIVTATCPNEDVNGNGILDASEDNKRRWFAHPRQRSVDSCKRRTTDANGQEIINLL